MPAQVVKISGRRQQISSLRGFRRRQLVTAALNDLTLSLLDAAPATAKIQRKSLNAQQ